MNPPGHSEFTNPPEREHQSDCCSDDKTDQGVFESSRPEGWFLSDVSLELHQVFPSFGGDVAAFDEVGAFAIAEDGSHQVALVDEVVVEGDIVHVFSGNQFLGQTIFTGCHFENFDDRNACVSLHDQKGGVPVDAPMVFCDCGQSVFK